MNLKERLKRVLMPPKREIKEPTRVMIRNIVSQELTIPYQQATLDLNFRAKSDSEDLYNLQAEIESNTGIWLKDKEIEGIRTVEGLYQATHRKYREAIAA